MTDGPIWNGEVRRRYPMWYEMVDKEDGGAVVAEFMDKTLADGTANRWNADLGKTVYYVRKKR